MADKEFKVDIFARGCYHSQGNGKYAASLHTGDVDTDPSTKETHGQIAFTTQERLDIICCIVPLEMLKKECMVNFIINSDTMYQAMTFGIPKSNTDLWDRLNKLTMIHDVTWIWATDDNHSHNTQKVFELADKE